MIFVFALSALFTFGGVFGSPVESTCHALTKLSADLNRTAIYFRNINSSASDLTVDETQKHPELYSNDYSPTDQLIQGISYIEDILEEIRSMNINSQLDSFVIPGLQKQLKKRIDTLTAGSGTAKVDNGVQPTINSLSQSLDRTVGIFSRWADICGDNGPSKPNPVKDAAQDNILCDILQILFYLTYYGLSNLDGAGLLIYYASGVFGCSLKFL